MKESLYPKMTETLSMSFEALYRRGLIHRQRVNDRAYLQYAEFHADKTLNEVAAELAEKCNLTPLIIKNAIRRARKLEMKALKEEEDLNMERVKLWIGMENETT